MHPLDHKVHVFIKVTLNDFNFVHEGVSSVLQYLCINIIIEGVDTSPPLAMVSYTMYTENVLAWCILYM